MKKSLLLGLTAILSAGSAFAGMDPATYEVIDGLQIKNRWLKSQYLNPTEFQAEPFMCAPNYARTATIAQYDGKDVVIVAGSKILDAEGTVLDHGMLYIYDLADGKLIKSVEPTLEGKPFEQLLCCNQIGTDDFGHVWFASYVASLYSAATETADAKQNHVTVYTVDLATGESTAQLDLTLPDSEASATGRIDYYDLVGDITRAEAQCVVLALPSGSDKPYVYGWLYEQGADEYIGFFDEYVSMDAITDTYPAEQTNWGTAPVIRIVRDEEFSASQFYIDGFVTCPSLYDTSGTMLDSFANNVDMGPKVGTNGVGEFTLDGAPYLVYSLNQYVSPEYCMIRIAKLPEDYAFSGMTALWDVPTGGLGETSDGGSRMHNVFAKPYTDENGVEGAYILTFKAANGIGVYTVAPENWVDPNGEAGINDIVADGDSSAALEYFNLNGVKVGADNLTPGLYITRQGSKVAKQVVK